MVENREISCEVGPPFSFVFYPYLIYSITFISFQSRKLVLGELCFLKWKQKKPDLTIRIIKPGS